MECGRYVGRVTLPETPPISDDRLIRSFAPITNAFCYALVMVGLLGAFVIFPDPTTTTTGLLIGAALGLASWFLPTIVIRRRLAGAARRQVPPQLQPALVRTVVMIGLALAEFPALLGFAITASSSASTSDIGPFVLSIPLAVASLILNVSGKGAIRRHLDRLRSPFAY